ncbi:hypothetical protein K501DRAFT_198400 [Backusella circina FSU 941]|nr:hypothetical protein K501DRAFT_198400 [Backusella circina FSU 941]
MFQSKDYIQRKHGRGTSDRSYYLTQLAQEYRATKDTEAKQQVLAHLANFAYDPINYDTLWDIYAVDIFIEAISNSDMKQREFGAGGLANICLEPRHHEYITGNKETLDALVSCLENSNSDVVKINAITCLMQLVTEKNYSSKLITKYVYNVFILFFLLALLSKELEQHLKTISLSSTSSKTLVNLTNLFLTDYYHY